MDILVAKYPSFTTAARVWHHDLQVMRKIRNEFAHGGIGTTFDQQKIKGLAKTLLIGKDVLPKHLKAPDKESIVPAKTYFMLAAAVLLAQIKMLRFNAPRLPESQVDGFVNLLPFQVTMGGSANEYKEQCDRENQSKSSE